MYNQHIEINSMQDQITITQLTLDNCFFVKCKAINFVMKADDHQIFSYGLLTVLYRILYEEIM